MSMFSKSEIDILERIATSLEKIAEFAELGTKEFKEEICENESTLKEMDDDDNELAFIKSLSNANMNLKHVDISKFPNDCLWGKFSIHATVAKPCQTGFYWVEIDYKHKALIFFDGTHWETEVCKHHYVTDWYMSKVPCFCEMSDDENDNEDDEDDYDDDDINRKWPHWANTEDDPWIRSMEEDIKSRENAHK